MKTTSISLFAIVLLLTVANLGRATPIDGSFVAARDCVAFVSFKKETNPDGVALTTGQSYVAIEINKPGGDWVRLVVPGATPSQRWVALVCGTLALQDGPLVTGGGQGGDVGATCSTKNQADSYVLALSWQPGFCEHTQAGPSKPECADLASGTLSTDDHFTLHGLWPNRSQCGTRYGNCDDHPLELDDETTAELSYWMPNAGYESGTLAQHEWDKHGTCQALSDDEYFKLSIALAKLVNQSVLGERILQNVGDTISKQDLLALVESTYGQDSSKRITLSCKSGHLVELQISLPLDPDPTRTLAELLQAAPIRGSGNCGSAISIEDSGS